MDMCKLYNDNGAWIILIKGATPIPYKIVTITSGFCNYDLGMFTLLSVITRGFRFGIVAALLYWRGEAVKHFIEKHLALSLFLILAGLVLGIVLIKYLF